MKKINLKPFLGAETLFTNKSNHIFLGANLSYLFNSENDYFNSYIMGLNIRYPIYNSYSNDLKSDIYFTKNQIIELKFGIGF